MNLSTIKTIAKKVIFGSRFLKDESIIVPPPEKYPLNMGMNSPIGTPDMYTNQMNDAKSLIYPEIDQLEISLGFQINNSWLEDLATVTQVSIKKSGVNYQHGRVLYSSLMNYLSKLPEYDRKNITIFETGTAKGFSSICMAKALIDSNSPGKIITLDFLSHYDKMFWNSILDHNGKHSREQLLSKWRDELEYILFIQGYSKYQLGRLGISRINFAFLDSQHSFEALMHEYNFVRDRQRNGDVIIFDDVTPGLFDDIVKCIDVIKNTGEYNIQIINSSSNRSYAIATKI